MKKLIGILVALVLIVVLLSTLLQKPTSKKHIAIVTFVEHPVLNTIERSFQETLKQIIDVNSYRITTTSAQGRMENLPSISRTITLQEPELILTISTPVTQAVMREVSDKQKVVYTFVTNPDDLGDELTRTNSTGLSDAVNYSENLTLINRIFGDNITIGMAYNPSEANSVYGIKQVEQLLLNTKTKLVKVAITKDSDVADAIRQLANVTDVIYVGGDNTTVGAISAVLSAAYDKSTPVIASDSGSIEAGAIAGVSVDYKKLGSQTSTVVQKVLNGAEPKTIPRVTLKGDKLIVNSLAAQQINLKLPSWLLEEADEIIKNNIQ